MDQIGSGETFTLNHLVINLCKVLSNFSDLLVIWIAITFKLTFSIQLHAHCWESLNKTKNWLWIKFRPDSLLTFPSMIPLARTFLTKYHRLVHKDGPWTFVSEQPRDYHTVDSCPSLVTRSFSDCEFSSLTQATEFWTRGGISGRHLSMRISDMTCRRF